MLTRVKAIWSRVFELRSRFEEDTYVFGKSALRWIHFMVNYVCRGGLSTVLVMVGQPVLTVVNLLWSLLVTVTFALWGPCLALLSYTSSVLLYDWRYYTRHFVSLRYLSETVESYLVIDIYESPGFFPLLRHLFRILVGVLEALLASAGVIVHPLLSVGIAALSSVQRGFRFLWDGAWTAALRRFGQWPAEDSFMAIRTKGPGILENYCFRLSTDLVKKCLLARLELAELQEARRIIQSAVRLPMKDLRMFAEDLLLGLGVGVSLVSSRAGVMYSMKKEEEGRLKKVGQAFDRREETLRRLTKLPKDRERIRPEKGVLVEELLQLCERVVDEFISERIEPLGKTGTDLWVQAGAARGVTRMVTRHLLCEMFSDDFLVPVETSELTVEIPIKFEDVINVYAGDSHTHRPTAR